MKFLKNSENELEKIQTQLDQEQYTMLEEMMDVLERIKEEHQHSGISGFYMYLILGQWAMARIIVLLESWL